MRPKPIPVWKLAKELGVDSDDVLIAVWDFEDHDGRVKGVEHKNALVPAPLVGKVRAALRTATQPLSDNARSLESPAEEATAPPRPAPCPPPSFDTIGRRRSLRLLKCGEVISLHKILVSDFAQSGDPIDPAGVKNHDLLESAIFRPHTGLGNVSTYPTAETSAAALLCAIIHDHPFHNGNKRTALVSMLIFLDENALTVTCEHHDLFRLVLRIAKHRMTDVTGPHASDYETWEVAKWIQRRFRSAQKSGQTLTFRALRTILEGYGCEIDIGSGQANIDRQRRRRWGRSRWLQTQVYYRNPGTDVEDNTVKKIREDLKLDAESGVDDADFFSKKPTRVDDYVAEYRKTLKRLARH